MQFLVALEEVLTARLEAFVFTLVVHFILSCAVVIDLPVSGIKTSIHIPGNLRH